MALDENTEEKPPTLYRVGYGRAGIDYVGTGAEDDQQTDEQMPSETKEER